MLVRDYDEAKAWYADVLGLKVVEDTALDNGRRWVLLAPPGSRETRVLLARAADPDQVRRVGDQTGGRVFLFLHTSDFAADYDRLRARGVRFSGAPRFESFGVVAVFQDLYGNRWDLLQPRFATEPPP